MATHFTAVDETLQDFYDAHAEIPAAIREEIEKQLCDTFGLLSDEALIMGAGAEAQVDTDDGGLFFTRTDFTDGRLTSDSSTEEIDALCTDLVKDAMARLRWYASSEEAQRAYAHGCF